MQSPDVGKNYSKKMVSNLNREYRKILRNLSGIRGMDRLPGAMFVVDVRREAIAIQEARKLRIPVIGLIDTDSDPDMVDIAIPANDDALRGIDLIMKEILAAVMEGKSGRIAKEEQDKVQQRVAKSDRSRRRTTTAQAEDQAAAEKPAAAEPVAESSADAAASGTA